ncbi:MAG: 50S ribosomal protein L25 [Patescibacteria group bacterium]
MTNTQHQLKAEPRTLFGKKSKQLRNKGQVPANISGKIKVPVAITVDAKEFRKIHLDAGETAVVYIQVDGEKEKRPTLIDSVDLDVMSRKPLHVTFRQVDLKEKVTATVPVELTGELAVTDASINQMFQEIEVEALPTDFPEAFTIDLTQFTEIGQEFTVRQLKADSTKLTLSLEPDEILLQVQELQQMDEEPVEAAPAEGVEGADGEGAPADGAKPAEGEAKADEKKEDSKE